MRPTKTILFSLPVLAMLFASVANAQLIVIDEFSESVDLSSTPWDTVISLPQYNPDNYGGSVLEEIMFTLDGEASSTVDLTAITESNVLEGDVGAFLTATNTDLGLSLNALPRGTYAPPIITAAAGSTTTLANVTGQDQDMLTLSGPDMDPYIGSGSFTVDLNAIGTASQSLAGGNLDVSHRTQAFGVLTVQYKVGEIVPEPTSISMLVFGLLGLAGFRRRN